MVPQLRLNFQYLINWRIGGLSSIQAQRLISGHQM